MHLPRFTSGASASTALARAIAPASLAAALISTFLLFAPTSPKPVTAPESDFSAARAKALLEKAARVPHPVYSEAKFETVKAIENYLRSAGFDTWTTAANIVAPKKKTGGSVTNLWALLKADDPAPGLKPVLLTAHYDSVPFGPGASDNGSGTATLAEAARAMAAMQPGLRALRRDIVFVWTDGEEFGQLGAEAAVATGKIDPAFALAIDTAKDTPLFIVDIAQESGKTLAFLAGARAGIIGFSWTDLVKGTLSVDSDYSPFRARGIPGACLGAPVLFTDYHSARDTADRADPGAMQQAGEALVRCALALARSDEPDFRGQPETYFPIGGIGLIHYPAPLNVFFLAIATLGLLLALIVPGRRPKAAKVLAGIGMALALMVLATAGGFAVAALGKSFAGDIAVPRYSAHLPLDWLWAAAAFALALALFFTALRLGRERDVEGEIAWGFAFLALIGAWFLAFSVPQASYVLAVPALAFAAAHLTSVVSGRAETWFAIAAAAAGIVMLPLFPTMFLGLGLRGIGTLVPAAMLALLALSPLAAAIPVRAKKTALAVSGGLAIAFAATIGQDGTGAGGSRSDNALRADNSLDVVPGPGVSGPATKRIGRFRHAHGGQARDSAFGCGRTAGRTQARRAVG